MATQFKLSPLHPFQSRQHAGVHPSIGSVSTLAVLSLLLGGASAAWAQSPSPLAASTQGITGGLVIPSAQVLPTGSLALTYGNFQENALGLNGTQKNFSLGLGLFQGFELYGRLADYTDPIAGSILFSGARDLSANVKFQLPALWATAPNIAVGFNDVAGGAAYFKSAYLVVSDQFGPVSATLGYARGTPRNDAPGEFATFNGVFGGLSVPLGVTGLSALAEYDGRQKHAGLRWHSPSIAALGNAQFVGTLQQSFGAQTPAGLNADAAKFAVSLMMPLGDTESKQATYKPSASQTLPALDAKSADSAMKATPADRLASLCKALVGVGLERVRVGLRDGMVGKVLVVEYENNRYAHNEADAIGLALGLGAEMAPAGTQRVHAITLKGGLPLYETSVGVTVFREFLRDGAASPVRDSLVWDRLGATGGYDVQWLDNAPSSHSLVRLELKPELAYAVGTEFAALDYSLAANLQVKVPLWRGARLQSNFVQQFANSPNAQIGGIFEDLRQRSGLKTLALQQSFWLNPDILTSVAVGRFHYDALGAQGEALAFIPGTSNLLRGRAAAYNQAPGGLVGQERTLAASYKHALATDVSLEAGVQKYGDGSFGPSVEWTRWFGDVSVQLFYRAGAQRKFAGLQLSFPLTPRQGMAPGPVVFSGPSQHAQSIRTRITDANEAANLVQPSAVRDLALESPLDVDQLNAGRLSQTYFAGQIHRMRQAFYIYATPAL